MEKSLNSDCRFRSVITDKCCISQCWCPRELFLGSVFLGSAQGSVGKKLGSVFNFFGLLLSWYLNIIH